MPDQDYTSRKHKSLFHWGGVPFYNGVRKKRISKGKRGQEFGGKFGGDFKKENCGTAYVRFLWVLGNQ